MPGQQGERDRREREMQGQEEREADFVRHQQLQQVGKV